MAKTFLQIALEALRENGCKRVVVTPLLPRPIYDGAHGAHCPHCHVQPGEEHLLGCYFAPYPDPDDGPTGDVQLEGQGAPHHHAARQQAAAPGARKA